MKTWRFVVAATIFGLVANGAALACEEFSANVPIEARQFEYRDISGNGRIDPGDKLVGRDGLYDKDSKEIGRLFVVSTIEEVDDNGIISKWADTQVYALPDGGIFAFDHVSGQKVNVRKHASGSFKENNTTPTTLRIIGGTGGYAGAGGTVVFSFTDGVGEFAVNVSCQ
jgi:hypothetical protein